MPEAGIVIVGGGLAGLSAAGALKQAGLDPVILDGGRRVGQSWEQRYSRLHLHTVRAYSGLAHFPIAHTYPKYLSKDQYAAYLREYAAHFELNIVPNTAVERIRPQEQAGRPGWAVEAGPQTWRARSVVVAAGQFNRPLRPDFPGLERFGGETLHSAAYRSGSAFRGRRVLVVGAGNSGMEIAVDLAEQGASQVAVSVRTPPPVVPRDFLGVPAQMFGIWMSAFPPAWGDRVGSFFARLAWGDLHRYGLATPRWGPFSARRPPVIDVGFVAALKAGQVGLRPALRAFTPGGVVFDDGRQEPFDAVVFATGFGTGLEELLEPPGLVDARGLPRFPSGAATSCPGLYFMGYFDSLRGVMYETGLASRRLAREIKAAARSSHLG